MASEISMNGRKKIETIQKEFTNKFPYLTLLFLDEKRKAIDISKSLSEVRQAKGDDISIVASLKVNTFEKRFQENFGIHVEVAYQKSGKIMPTKGTLDKTLNELNKWCEQTGCEKFSFKKSFTGNTLLSIQEQLYEGINENYPDAEAKKINKDNFVDISIPSLYYKKGTHLFFNTAKDGIRVGFYCKDKNFTNRVLEGSEYVEEYSGGIRIKGNPSFNDAQSAVRGAIGFIGIMMGESDADLITALSENEKQPEDNGLSSTKSYNDTIEQLKSFDGEAPVKLTAHFGNKAVTEKGSVSGEYNGVGYSLEYTTTWRGGYLTGDGDMTVNDVIKVLKKKTVDKMTDKDIYGLRPGSLQDGQPEYSEISWDEELGSNEETPDAHDLYGSGDIDDCEYYFDGIESLEINVQDYSTTIS